MINIKFNSSYATITNLSLDALEAIKYNLTVFIDDEELEKYTKLTNLPICTSELNRRHLIKINPDGSITILTGLIFFIIKKLKQFNLNFTLTKEVPDAELEKKPVGETTREEQKELIDIAIKYKRCQIQAFTAFGKSHSLAHYCNQFSNKSVRLILVPTIDLLYQMQGDICKWLGLDKEEVGLIGDNNWTVKPITIAIPNTLTNRIKEEDRECIEYLNSVNVLVVDEAHMYCNPSFVLISEYIPNAEYRLAVSATLYGASHKELMEGLFGPIAREFKAQEGIDKGRIMNPKLRFIPSPPAFAPARLLNSDYSHWAFAQLYDRLIVLNEGRNKLAIDLFDKLYKKYNKPIVLLVKKVGTTKKKNEKSKEPISHADILRDMLLEAGYDVPIRHGATKNKEEILERVTNNEVPGLIASVKTFGTGISINSIGGIILMAAGSQVYELEQRVGRAVRTEEGKERPYIIDFWDTQSWFYNQSSKRFEGASAIYPDVKLLEEVKDLYKELE